MNFIQAISFDTNKGGRIPNLCLDNVRRGYSISNKYGSAWEAWEHTQQHQDRNIPDGLDVPLYYSYTATIDGVTKNYGHINVRLSNGTVWSDGNIYASINAYTANHSPKFVGWGESVNDFKVLKGGNMPTIASDEDIGRVYLACLGRAPSAQELADNRGVELHDLLKGVIESKERETYALRVDRALSGGNANFTPVTEQLFRKG